MFNFFKKRTPDLILLWRINVDNYKDLPTIRENLTETFAKYDGTVNIFLPSTEVNDTIEVIYKKK